MILLLLAMTTSPRVPALRTSTHAPIRFLARVGSHGIPAFSRKYRTSCSTCHIAAPKLNVMGEAFRLNGYRFPDNDQLLRKDEPVPLGEEEWKALWPRAIPPGELPNVLPLALRIQNDIQFLKDGSGALSTSFLFPSDVYLLGAATLGGGLAAFMETEWNREEGFEVLQAKVLFQDPLPFLPPRSLNLWVGLQNLFLFTFADRQIDRAGRLVFRWQEFSATQMQPIDPAGSASTDAFSLRATQPALEANGIGWSRIGYAVGVSQGASSTTRDNNSAKDAYYRVRWKIGGLGLDGRYAQGAKPVLGGGGQLLDRSLVLEQFGYWGEEPVAGGAGDRHRHFGVAARGLLGPLDAGVGYVLGRYDRPWGTEREAGLEVASVFAKVEYLAFPWLMPTFKFEDFRADPQGRDAAAIESQRQTRLMPGAVFLIRQNLRGVVEAEFFTRHAPQAPDSGFPRTLWLRLDLAF